MTAAAGGSARPRPPGTFLRRCARWDAALANAETVLLAILILGSLAASLVQIVLRNLGLPALPETDTAVRRAVLWIAFIGASLAAFRGSHLAVDVAEQVLPPRANRLVNAAAGLIAAGVTALLTVASARFVAAELTFAGLGSAVAAAVMPLGFAMITLRFLLGAAHRLTGPDAAPPAAAMQARPTAGGPASSAGSRTGTGGDIAPSASPRNPAARLACGAAVTCALAMPPGDERAPGGIRHRSESPAAGNRPRSARRRARYPRRPAAGMPFGTRNHPGGGS